MVRIHSAARRAFQETQLECANCHNSIPYCVVTGKHMVISDASMCPSCRFPATYSGAYERRRPTRTHRTRGRC